MEKTNLILIEQFCTNHNIEFSFIDSLKQFGLVEIIIIDEQKYLPHDQLSDVERMMRLHYELDINMEGIDAISNLLKQINDLKRQLVASQNSLRRFEE
jgi:signal transduction histidine kinase